MFSQVSVCPQWRGRVWWGHAWQGACVKGGMHCQGAYVQGRGACMTGETATVAGDTHPTRMHSCFLPGRVLLQHL